MTNANKNPKREEDNRTAYESLLQRNVDTIHQIERAAQTERNIETRVADAIAGFCGSIAFVWVHVAWFGSWLLVNSTNLFDKRWRFDPAPFPMLTLVVSLEAIFLSTFILISQNRQQAISEQRNNLDLQVNLLAEQENSETLRLLKAIGESLGLEIPTKEIEVMSEATDIQEISRRLDEVNRNLGKDPLAGS